MLLKIFTIVSINWLSLYRNNKENNFDIYYLYFASKREFNPKEVCEMEFSLDLIMLLIVELSYISQSSIMMIWKSSKVLSFWKIYLEIFYLFLDINQN